MQLNEGEHAAESVELHHREAKRRKGMRKVMEKRDREVLRERERKMG